jgi:hypothetical protein
MSVPAVFMIINAASAKEENTRRVSELEHIWRSNLINYIKRTHLFILSNMKARAWGGAEADSSLKLLRYTAWTADEGECSFDHKKPKRLRLRTFCIFFYFKTEDNIPTRQFTAPPVSSASTVNDGSSREGARWLWSLIARATPTKNQYSVSTTSERSTEQCELLTLSRICCSHQPNSVIEGGARGNRHRRWGQRDCTEGNEVNRWNSRSFDQTDLSRERSGTASVATMFPHAKFPDRRSGR